MAGEIQADYPTGATLYAQVRTATGTVWNTVGLAFEAYLTANIADYDIAMAEQGTASGYYAGDFPTIAGGIYNVVVKSRVGGSPAESDPTVASGFIEWSGTAVVSQTGDSFARLGDPAGVSVSADVAAVKADTGNLVTRITSTLFSGITSLASWLGAIAGKTADAGTQTEIRATTAGAGYTVTTDSLEAIRDRGDAAWLQGTGTSTLTTGDIPTTAQIADKLLGRSIAGGEDGGRTVYQALAAGRNNVAFDVTSAGSFTVYGVDDTTVLFVGTYNRGSTSLGPLTNIDPTA